MQAEQANLAKLTAQETQYTEEIAQLESEYGSLEPVQNSQQAKDIFKKKEQTLLKDIKRCEAELKQLNEESNRLEAERTEA